MGCIHIRLECIGMDKVRVKLTADRIQIFHWSRRVLVIGTIARLTKEGRVSLGIYCFNAIVLKQTVITP